MQKTQEQPAADALRYLTDDLGPRILKYLFSEPDIEQARTLHTELRKLIAIARGDELW